MSARVRHGAFTLLWGLVILDAAVLFAVLWPVLLDRSASIGVPAMLMFLR